MKILKQKDLKDFFILDKYLFVYCLLQNTGKLEIVKYLSTITKRQKAAVYKQTGLKFIKYAIIDYETIS